MELRSVLAGNHVGSLPPCAPLSNQICRHECMARSADTSDADRHLRILTDMCMDMYSGAHNRLST